MLKRAFFIFLYFCVLCNTNAQINLRYWLNSGRNKIINNDNLGAIADFNTVLKFVPDNDEAYYLRAIAKYNLDDFRGSVDDFSKAINANPMNSFYFLFRGETREKLYDLKGAREDYDKALEIKPNNTDAYISRGINYILIKKYNEALADFDMAIMLSKNNSHAYLYRALAKQYKEQFADANTDFTKAIALNPFSADAYIKRGRNSCEMKDYKAGIDDFNTAIRIDSANSYAYFNRAIAKVDIFEYNGAIDDFAKVVQLEPDNALTYFNRADIWARLNKFDKAIDDYNAVLQINPDNVFTYFNRAIMWQKLNNYRNAVDDYSSAIALNPEFAAAYYNRSVARSKLNDIVGAQMDMMAAEKINTAHQDTTYKNKVDSTGLAKLIELKADFDAYNTQISKSKELGIMRFTNFYIRLAQNEEPHKLFASLSALKMVNNELAENSKFIISNKEIKISRDSLQILIAPLKPLSDFENNAAVLFKRGLLYSESQEFNAAIDDFSQLIKKEAHPAMAYFCRANARYEFISIINAINDYSNNIIKIGVDNSFDKGNVPVRKSKVDYIEVISDYKKCIELDSTSAIYYFNLANVLIDAKDYNAAIHNLSRAIDIEPRFAEAHFNRGLTYIYLKEKVLGCSDVSIAGELGIESAYMVIKKFCNK